MLDDVIASFLDPCEPKKEDRDEVVLKSGPSQGRPWTLTRCAVAPAFHFEGFEMASPEWKPGRKPGWKPGDPP